MGQIKNFQELEVWQKTHQLVLAVYQATKAFPGDENNIEQLMADAEIVSRLLIVSSKAFNIADDRQQTLPPSTVYCLPSTLLERNFL